MISLSELNNLPVAGFVQRLSGVFEHSPWVAERAAAARPFASRHDLLEGLRAAVVSASPEEQFALICAHPRLGLRGRARSDLTRASSQEQSGAGLDAILPHELARLDELNQLYADKFSMPFILAVRGHSPESIIAACERRLAGSPADERRKALEQIHVIAGYRLADIVKEDE